MSAVEVTSWTVVRPTTPDLVDFRVHRTHFGTPHTYTINAKQGSYTCHLVDFTTSGPLTNELRDACINLARCSS